MQCRKCRANIPDESVFCMKCGTKQAIKERSKSRGNGQGTAIKRGKTWTAIWTERVYAGVDGKPKQKQRWKSGFTSKTAALAFAAAPKTEAPKVPTLRNYYDTWKSTDYRDLSKSKQTAFNIAWKRLDGLADKRMDELTIRDLQFTVDEQTPTYYPARDLKTLLSHLFKLAVAEGNARTNLAQFIRLPPLDEKEMQPFNKEELQKLWKAYGDGDTVIGYALLMIYSGMMPGELIRFRSSMVNWETNEILGCGLKTKKRKETPIVFPDMISPVLADLIDKSNSKTDFVLGMNKWDFYDRYHASLKSAGVRDLPPYSCRHTTATALALGNIAPSVIQEVMRHTKFSTTQRYIHPDTASARAAVNTLSKGAENAKK